MRRFITLILVALFTLGASLWWLHDGDLVEAVQPVMVEWDAQGLAKNAGIESPPPANPHR